MCAHGSVANVIHNIAQVRPLGIVGDAIGTPCPLPRTTLFFAAAHVPSAWRSHSQIPYRAYSYRLALCLPMIIVLVLLQRSFYAHRYPRLILNLLAGSLRWVGGSLVYPERVSNSGRKCSVISERRASLNRERSETVHFCFPRRTPTNGPAK